MYSMTFSKEYFLNKIKTNPKLAKEFTDNNSYRNRTAFFRLRKYSDGFLSGKTDIRLIIMHGLRGIGKTTLLFQLYNYLIEKIPPEEVIYLSADELQLQEKEDSVIYKSITAFIKEIHETTIESIDKKIFIFMDEAQFDKQWSTAAKTIFDSTKNIFLIITGSSALSLNLNTDTARRSIKEPIFPVSFLEYEIIKNNIFPKLGTAKSLKSLLLNIDENEIKFLNNVKNDLEKQFQTASNLENEVKEFLRLGGFGFSFQSSYGIVSFIYLDNV